MNKRYYWLKLNENFFNDPMVKVIRFQPKDGNGMVIAYLEMLLATMNTDGKFEYIGFRCSVDEELAFTIGEPLRRVQLTLSLLEQLRLCEPTEYGLLFKAAAEMTGTEGGSTGRMRRLREKNAEEKSGENGKGKSAENGDDSKAQCDADVTPEKEKEKEKKKEEKEIELFSRFAGVENSPKVENSPSRISPIGYDWRKLL